MPMSNPPHPGKVLKEMYIDPLGLSITKAAEALDISRRQLSLIINGHNGISPEMAMKLSKAFDTTPDLWLNMQKIYNLWNARETDTSKVKVLSELEAV